MVSDFANQTQDLPYPANPPALFKQELFVVSKDTYVLRSIEFAFGAESNSEMSDLESAEEEEEAVVEQEEKKEAIQAKSKSKKRKKHDPNKRRKIR